MKKMISIVLAAAMVLTMSMMFASCGNKNNDTSDTTSKTETTAPEKEAVRVTVIAADTFVEGSYSGLAKAGLEKLEKDYGVKGTLKECGGKNFKAAMEEAAKSSDIIIPIGWQFESVDMVAAKYPKVKFIWLDNTKDTNYDNLIYVTYAENQGAFLAGYIAAKTSKSGVIGAVGGMDNDSVEDFITGYRQGAEYADSHIKVLTNFIGNFSNTAKAGECALQLNNKGADVVFQIAGAAGTGVFDAAKQYGFYAIGVDTDQKSIDPSHIICSVTKDIGQSIYDIVGDYCKDGTWEGGKTVDFDMKSGYISISYGTDEMEQQVSESLKNDVLDLQKKIEDGDIVVDSAI